jgi:hypothetical protein
MRRVFVGSSTEGRKEAAEVCHLLKSEDTEAVYWPEIFAPSSLTFEALESMLLECCGAVFVATPDDDGTIRGRRVKMPRANVMLEFGLVAGRLGRANIALCQYGQAELPSDLEGLTVVRMDRLASDKRENCRNNARHTLHLWSSQLVDTAEKIVRTQIVHGYTGRWTFAAQLMKWRGLRVDYPSFAELNGFFDLYLRDNPSYLRGDQIGRGTAHCRLTFELFDSRREDQPPFRGEFRVAHEIANVCCSGDGGLSFISTAFALHLMTPPSGLPTELTGLTGPPEPWAFQWELRATGKDRVLEGSLTADAGGRATEGRVTITKEP